MKIETIQFPYIVIYEYEDELFDIYHLNLTNNTPNPSIDADKIIENIKFWCSETLGIEGVNWKYDFIDEDRFHFKKENYRSLFLLKWTAPHAYSS